MQRTESILVGLALVTACSHASAQQAINMDSDYELTDIIFDLGVKETRWVSTLTPISLGELSELRAGGVDPTWIAERFEIPSFDSSTHRVTQSDHPLMIESWATQFADQRGVQLNDKIWFSVGRTTELRDGNISGSEGTLASDDSVRDHIPSLAQSEGEYDIYDLSFEWEAIKAGPVTVSLLSGLKAIEANIGKRITTNGDTRIETVHRFAALPMVGSGVRWKISDALSFSGAALTHPIDSGDALIDFNASTELRLSKNVGFSAGYRIIRSSFEVGSVNTQLEQEGLFARLQISF
ncbi:MAG: hypothetical protein JKX70_01185 [Phycisphaerales bacterium]|nr:hypothetical protein [Phycisphaerales bacterium]